MRQRRIPRITSLLCTLPLLTGCFAYDTTVRLSPDGSGTVEQELVLTGGMAAMLSMADTAGEGGPDLCEEQDLGEGVRRLSAEPIEEAERVGCRQVYAFTDINTLRLLPDPGEVMPEGLAREEEAAEEPREPITFAFRPGSPATLVVRMPPREPEEADEDAGEEDPEEAEENSAARAMALAMMREMLRGSRYSVQLVLPGEIVETDASYREGDRITLVELDFDALLEDPEALERLTRVKDPSPAQARALLEETPGMKVEMRDEVTVRFR